MASADDAQRSAAPADRVLYVVGHHHFDIVWRRSLEGYIQVRDGQITRVLELLERFPQFKFTFCQAAAVRYYLRDHPEAEDVFRRHIVDGRVEIVGGMETIADTNMPCGEALIRNILVGREWWTKRLGADVKMGCQLDAFGMCAQLPQILADCGYEYLMAGRVPNTPPGFAHNGGLWEGLDGSQVVVGYPGRAVQTSSRVCNVPVTYTALEHMERSLRQAVDSTDPWPVMFYATEEELIFPEVFDMMDRVGRETGVPFEFVLATPAYELLADRRRRGELPTHHGDINPEFTGTYTTRIRLKQAYRQAERRHRDAELWCALAHVMGHRYPAGRLDQGWRDLSLVQFHDALCGCHAEPVYKLCMRRCASVTRQAGRLGERATQHLADRVSAPPGCAVVFNPLSWQRLDVTRWPADWDAVPVDATGTELPVQADGDQWVAVVDVPACGYRAYPMLAKRGQATVVPEPVETPVGSTIETDHYQATLADRGLTLVDKQQGWTITRAGQPWPELHYREDAGDLWSELYLGSRLDENRSSSRLVGVEQGPVWIEARWEGEFSAHGECNTGRNLQWNSFGGITWTKRLRFYRRLPRIDILLDLDFRGSDTKISMTVPADLKPETAQGHYAVPLAGIPRKPYYEVPASSPDAAGLGEATWHDKNGDWPTLDWAAYEDGAHGVLLGNTGTPGHRLQEGRIEVSLVRSPTGKSSGFQPPRQACDNGHHAFTFAMTSYAGSYADTRSYRLGLELNHPLTVVRRGDDMGPLPAQASLVNPNAPNVMVTAVKRAQKGRDLIVRTVEYEGRPTQSRVSLFWPIDKWSTTNVLEQADEPVAHGHVAWGAHQMRTVRARQK